MDDRAIAFLEVMGGIAVLALACFVIVVIAIQARSPADDAAGDATGGTARALLRARARGGYPMILAAVLLVAACAALVWHFDPLSLGEQEGGVQEGGEAGAWRTQPGASAFFIVMLVGAGLGALAFLVIAVMRTRAAPAAAIGADAGAAAAEDGGRAPTIVPLLGLAFLILAVLLLGWAYLARAQQYQLMLYLAYPAAFAVALVLLLDKAARGGTAKGTAESLREWMFCDGLAFFLVLGFVNLAQAGAGEKYAGFFWDAVHIVAFFVVFWAIDRGTARVRFLIGYAYFALAPILLVIWRASQKIAGAEDLSWWQTWWPVFYLALAFLIVEIAVLVGAREASRHGLPALKDAAFFVLYAVLLLVGLPGTGE